MVSLHSSLGPDLCVGVGVGVRSEPKIRSRSKAGAPATLLRCAETWEKIESIGSTEPIKP
jgi:hypothetical protein